MLGLYLVTGAISLQRKLRFSVGSKLRVPREPVSLGCVKPSKAWGYSAGRRCGCQVSRRGGEILPASKGEKGRWERWVPAPWGKCR